MDLDCGKEIDLRIDRLGVNGEGVGRFDGLTIFVDSALPGENVRARIYEKRKNFARARVIDYHNYSADRVKPQCPLFERCGGCQLMHLAYPKQLEAKRARVIDALQRIAKIDCEVMPCVPSPKPLAYRNKIQLPVNENNRLGLYARNTHDLVEIEHCAIHCDLGEKVFSHIQEILKNSEKGTDLKHVLIKTSVNTKQVLVIFITKSHEPPTLLAEQIFSSSPEIKGVVQNINPDESNVILGSEFRTLIGQGWIEEQLLDLRFKVSPASFFQVNPMQAETLYQKVLDLACLNGNERVLDAYCGVGTLSLILARKALEVFGIESVSEAIADANENARLNGIGNTKFLCGSSEKEISKLGEIDVAVANPPRKGCDPAFLESLAKKKPRKIIYISCDPATLARDLHFLTEKGYRLEIVYPFDMFPQTTHVESVAVLSLAESKSTKH